MNVTPLVMIALLGAAFWLLVIRPAKAKQAAQHQLVSQVKVGDRIMTTAGLFGYVTEVRDEEVGVEIADGVKVLMVKPAIARIIPVIEVTDGAAESESQAPATPDPHTSD